MSEVWDGLSYSYKLHDTSVIATYSLDRGAISETGLVLDCWEGRRPSYHNRRDARSDQATAILEYAFDFEAEGEIPEAAEQVEARIVIVGKRENGALVEIRGTGLIGYDDRGAVCGTFYDPPSIILEDDDDDKTHPQDDFSRQIKAPAQYHLAMRRLPEREDPEPRLR